MKVWLLEIWHVFDFFGSFISRFISGCAATLGIVLDNFLLPSNLVEASLSCLFVLIMDFHPYAISRIFGRIAQPVQRNLVYNRRRI